MSTVREANAKKDTGTAVVAFVVMFAVLSFVAGILTSGMFLAGPPAADLKAEYCRGIGDGENRMYNSMRDFFVGIEQNGAAAGVEVVSVAIRDGEIVEKVVVSEQVFPPVTDLNLSTEQFCYDLPVEQQIAQFGVRGPSDYVASTTTVLR